MTFDAPLEDYLPALTAAQKQLKQAQVGRQWKDGTRRSANLSLTEARLLKKMVEAFVSEPGLSGWRIGWGASDDHPFSKATVDAVVTTQEPKALGRIDDYEYQLTLDLEVIRNELFKNEGPRFREQFFGNVSVKAEVVITRENIEDRIEACIGVLGMPAFREALLTRRLEEPSTVSPSRPRM